MEQYEHVLASVWLLNASN